MTFVGLESKLKAIQTTNRDSTSVHPPWKNTEEHNRTVPGNMMKHVHGIKC
jgi:hypothetical protein